MSDKLLFCINRLLGEGDTLSWSCLKQGIEGADILDFCLYRAFFVQDTNFVPYLEGEREEKNDPRSDIAQYRPLGKECHSYHRKNRGDKEEYLVRLHPPDGDNHHSRQKS